MRAIRTGGATTKRRGEAISTPRVAPDRLGRPLTWGLGAAVLAVPLVFRKGELDAFARPKYLVLGLATAVLLALAAARLWVNGSRIALRRVPDALVAAFVLWNAVAFAMSEIGTASFHGEPFQYQGFAAVLLYATGYLLVRLAPDRSVVPVAAVAAGAVVSVYGMVQYVDLDPLWDVLFKGRIFSTFGQPNNLAAFLVMVLPFALVLTRQRQPALRWLGWVAFPLIAVTALLTMSRGAYVALGVASAATLAMVLGRLPIRRVLQAAAAAVVILAVVVAIPATRSVVADVVDRGASLAGPLDSSNDKRVDLWVVGVAIANDHPILGVGQESYPELFPAYAATELDADSREALAPFRPESPHNVYLATAVAAGWPALLLYLGLIGWALTEATRRFRATGHPLAGAVFFAIVGHVVTDAFMTAEIAGSWLFWLLIGWLAATTGTPISTSAIDVSTTREVSSDGA